ncbi:AraC family transcriptional regulator [Pendulispora brunnea]|uniref:AraC family transcriptional regulator n=1 Tax=Pendulispora brunnea TaxID=2905690 RepID=A0ABZ2KA70_9BACT
MTPSIARAWSSELATYTTKKTAVQRLDPRIAKAMSTLARNERAPTIAQMAGAVRLSQSRFSHLFAAETGTTYRHCFLLSRLQDVVNMSFIQHGSMTQAAHSAGFADLAHCSRTYRRIIGVSPGIHLKDWQLQVVGDGSLRPF